ncbi:MAG: type III polyketide synthase [Cyclobacteriaceae bacterium]
MKAYISAMGLSNPPNRISQRQVAEFMVKAHQLEGDAAHRLKALYRATGIGHRYSVLNDYAKSLGEFEFYSNQLNLEPFPSTAERMAIYRPAALKLGTEAIERCLAGGQVPSSQITHLITVSCTGMYAPGLDLDLVNALSLPTSIERTAINFMGCYAAMNALKVGRSICQAQPEANVLILCLEICSIHFQKEPTEDYLLSNALFGDGAAAVLLQSQPNHERALQLVSAHCGLLPSSQESMAWEIGNLGFEMKLASYVPDLIGEGIQRLTQNLLSQAKIATTAIDFYAIHPGGKKILGKAEEALGICKQQNLPAHQVLREYGNMSSPTILFVLKKIWDQLGDQDREKHILAFAFGPGLTLESMLFKVS